MTRRGVLHVVLLATIVLGLTSAAWAAKWEEARMFIEYNSTDNDLGFHVFADAEDWSSMKIVNPAGRTIYQIDTGGAFRDLGMSELFTEGAEPSLDDVPLVDLLAQMPEGKYKFIGVTVDETRLSSTAILSHAVPAGPVVSTDVNGDQIVISWQEVTSTPPGFPQRPIHITGYQIIVDPFQVTLPASSREVTLPVEFVRSLDPGTHGFEVLAIDVSGNQTITAGEFETN